MKKAKVKINKPVYLGMPILEINKTLMYQKVSNNAKLCYMDKDFIIHIKTEEFY